VGFRVLRANEVVKELRYDRVISCTGFRFDDSIFAPEWAVDGGTRPLPRHDVRLRAGRRPGGSTFAGTLMQVRDFKAFDGRFIHGFRYAVGRSRGSWSQPSTACLAGRLARGLTRGVTATQCSHDQPHLGRCGTSRHPRRCRGRRSGRPARNLEDSPSTSCTTAGLGQRHPRPVRRHAGVRARPRQGRTVRRHRSAGGPGRHRPRVRTPRTCIRWYAHHAPVSCWPSTIWPRTRKEWKADVHRAPLVVLRAATSPRRCGSSGMITSATSRPPPDEIRLTSVTERQHRQPGVLAPSSPVPRCRCAQRPKREWTLELFWPAVSPGLPQSLLVTDTMRSRAAASKSRT